MRAIDNLKQLVFLDIDLVGFIFHPPSKRHVEADGIDTTVLKNIKVNHLGIEKVGVFVNKEFDFIIEKVKEFQLDAVQLHGEESFSFCNKIKKKGIKVIKAFSISDNFNFRNLAPFSFSCDLFLFDTKGKLPGGNGVPFDWTLIEKYQEETPFLLSGGIGPDSLEALAKFSHPQWAGIDVNSKFETVPGQKNIDQLKSFIERFREDHPRVLKNYY